VRLSGGELRLVPPEGALYLEPPAYVYVSEVRRRLEVEVEAAERVASASGTAPSWSGSPSVSP